MLTQQRMAMARAFEGVLKRMFPGTVNELISHSVADSLNVLNHLNKDSDSTEGSEDRTQRLSRISDLRKMYKGEAKYGNVLCGAVVNFNRAFQMANGVTAIAADEETTGSDTHELVRDFLDYNNLTEERALDLGTASELEGQVVFRWSWDDKAKHVKVYAVPLIETQYEVEYKDGDYTKPTKLVVFPKSEQDRKAYPAKDFVFVKFRAIPNGTYGIPTPMGCIEDMKNYDAARADLRSHNHLFAAPTPVVVAKNQSRVAAISTKLGATN